MCGGGTGFSDIFCICFGNFLCTRYFQNSLAQPERENFKSSGSLFIKEDDEDVKSISLIVMCCG